MHNAMKGAPKGLKKVIWKCLISTILSWVPTSAIADCPNGLLEAPWRGISCLHCLHPLAPEGPQPIVQVLTNSCLKRVMTAFVIDGTFGWNPDAVRTSLDSLSSEGREAWVHFYVYNGPAQRRWSSGLFHSFAVMHPATFLRKLKESLGFQDVYREIVETRVAPLVEYALARGIKVSIAPGLEDTLDREGFQVALALTKSALPSPEKVTWARSACYKCRGEGSQSLPLGVIKEIHTSRTDSSLSDGIVHTDGEYFRFKGDNDPSMPRLGKWRALLEAAESRSNAFLLWVPKYQDAPPGLLPRSPDAREYKRPSKSEERELIRFLRGGQ